VASAAPCRGVLSNRFASYLLLRLPLLLLLRPFSVALSRHRRRQRHASRAHLKRGLPANNCGGHARGGGAPRERVTVLSSFALLLLVTVLSSFALLSSARAALAAHEREARVAPARVDLRTAGGAPRAAGVGPPWVSPLLRPVCGSASVPS
jgi:hypothetical protein